MQISSVVGQMRTTPIATMGGTVIALLLKAKKKKQQNLSSLNYIQSDNLMAGIIPVTARLQEAYSFESDVTQHAVESGALVSDHVILRPVKVDLVFEINNIPDSTKAKEILDTMVDMWQSRQPVDLMTEHSLLTSMICTSCQAMNESPEWGKLAFRASFKQVKWITLEAVKYEKTKVASTEKTKGPNKPKKAQSRKQAGTKQPKKVSALKKVFN